MQGLPLFINGCDVTLLVCITFLVSHLDWLPILCIVNADAANMGVQVSFQNADSISFGDIAWNGMGLYDELIHLLVLF